MEKETDDGLLEFARFTGPGTAIYPSPKPGEVKDLVLPAMRWVQVDPVFLRNGIFMRARNKQAFEVVQAMASPDDLDLSVPEHLDRALSNDQRELIREIVLNIAKDIKPEYKNALEVANLVSEAGIPASNSSVTGEYLRNHHRPFLMALAHVEARYQKRKALLALIKKQLDRINRLPIG